MGSNPIVDWALMKRCTDSKSASSEPHAVATSKDGDLIELDHIIPKRLGGTNELKNLLALHRPCHGKKTTLDGSYGTLEGRALNDNEPD